jgi:hypothetical protein
MLLKKGVLVIVVGVVLLGLISCQGTSVTSDPKARLHERVEGFIKARQAADQIALQSFYLNPGKAKVGNIKHVSSEITAISFGDDNKSAQVKLKNSIQAMGFTFKNTPQTLNWVWQKSGWFVVVDPNANPFGKTKQ